MQLIDQRLYPAGETYSGEATEEVDHFEFLITYGVNDAVSIIFSAIEQAAAQQGFVLLRTEMYYESGTLYHLFDVKYYFVQLAIPGTGEVFPGEVFPTVAPLTILLYIVAIIIVGIVGYILVRSLNLSLNSVQYEPTGPGGTTPSWSPLSYAVILIGAAFLLNAITGVSKEVRKY